jgi:hypothetical protein
MRVSLCYELISSAERNKRERERTSKRHVGEANSVLITVILLPQRLEIISPAKTRERESKQANGTWEKHAMH